MKTLILLIIALMSTTFVVMTIVMHGTITSSNHTKKSQYVWLTTIGVIGLGVLMTINSVVFCETGFSEHHLPVDYMDAQGWGFLAIIFNMLVDHWDKFLLFSADILFGSIHLAAIIVGMNRVSANR